MKLYQHNQNSAVLYKFLGILFLNVLFLPLKATTINVDSLKHVLKTSNNQKDNCNTLFKIYEYYQTVEQVDSMNAYAINCLKECSQNKKESSIIIDKAITKQYRQGFASNINPIADSLLLVIKDPDFILRLLVSLSKASFYNEEKKTFGKYWRQAELALANTKEDYSKFVYYNFLGAMNTDQNNIFAALQSFELAEPYVDENSPDYIKNSLNIAYIYLANKEIEKAKYLFKNLLIKAKENNQLSYQSYIYYALMDCYFLTEDYFETINIAHESINHSLKNNLTVPEGYSYSKLGGSYLALSNADTINNYQNKSADYNRINNTSKAYLDSAKYYLEKGIEYSLENNDSRELGDNYFWIANYYKAIGNNDKTKLYLRKAQNEDYYDKPEIDKELADLWAADNNYRKNSFHLNKYIDHMIQKEKDEKKDLALATKIIEDAYTYKKESQANLLIAKQKEERLRNIIAITIIGLILIASLLIYLQKNRKKLEALNKKIGQRRKEIGQRNKELDILINKQKETIKYLDNFASVAAHDLKAPIRTASLFAGSLTKISGDKLNDKERGYLKYISASVSQLSEMIDDLLSLSRLDSDLPEEKEVNLKEVVLDVKSLLSNLLSNTESKIVVETTLPKILGHSTLISQLFQNIIKNAIVHNKTGNKTVVKIAAESVKDNMHTIKISDNSGGIPEHLIPTMFDLFSTSDKNSGNGIGLATCKKIVNHYGGEIWVDVEPGVGSTFNFNLFS